MTKSQTNSKESEFLAGRFADLPIPKPQRYILRYFRSELERQFLKYHLWIGDHARFTEHTGYFCQEKWLRILKDRYDEIVNLHRWAKSLGTEEGLSLLSDIERGKMSFKQLRDAAAALGKGDTHEKTDDLRAGRRPGDSPVALGAGPGQPGHGLPDAGE